MPLNKFKMVNFILWLAYILALASSVNHLAWAFGKLEFTPWVGWIPALAVDFGLAALAYAIQQRKRARRQTRMLWYGVIAFSAISAFANLLHAIAVVSAADTNITWETIKAVDGLTLTKAIILSASLPLLVVYLGEIVSSDDADAAKAAEREQRRQERAEEAATPEAAVIRAEARKAAGTVVKMVKTKPRRQARRSPEFDRLLEAVHEQAGFEPFGQADVQEWTGRGKTSVYALLGYGEEAGRIEQVSRGRYVYRNGVGR